MPMHPSENLFHAVCGGDVETTEALIDTYGLGSPELRFNADYLLWHALKNERSAVAKLLLNNVAEVNMKDNEGETPLHQAAAVADVEIAELLIERGASIEAQSNAGKSALHKAVESGRTDIVSLLLKKRANVNVKDNQGETPLHYMPFNRYIILVLLDNGADVNATANNNETPLHVAIRQKRVETVKLLLERGAKVDSMNEDGKSVLYTAVEAGTSEILQIILYTHQAGISEANRRGFNLAICRQMCGDDDKVQALWGYGFRVRKADATDPQLLHGAVKGNHLEMLETLLDFGANVNTLDVTGNGKSLLHTAAYYNHCDLVDILLRRGADVNIKDNMQKSSLDYAIQAGDTIMAKELLHAGASIRMTKELLHGAVKMEFPEIVEITLNEASNLDFNETDYQGRTTLHHALDSELHSPSRAQIVKMLIDRGALVNAKTENNTTALHLAVEGGYAKAVEILLANGADVNAVGELNKTPLLLAYTGENTDIFKMLLDSGANVNDHQDDQNTALHIASKNGALIDTYGLGSPEFTCNADYLFWHALKNSRCAVAKLLLNNVAEVNMKDNDGETPLHQAAAIADVEIAKILIERGASIEARSNAGKSALHKAVESGRTDIVSLLLKKRANVNVKDNQGETPLHYMPFNRYIILVLLDNGADVNATANNNETPLHVAIRHKRDEVVKLLLERGTKVDSMNEDGKSVLYTAVEAGTLEILQIILNRRPSVSSEANRRGFHLAICRHMCGDDDKVKALLQYGFRVRKADAKDPQLAHGAAKGGDLEMLETLLHFGANVNILHVTGNGKSLLHTAAYYHHYDIVDILLRRGADIKIKDNMQKSSLDYAIQVGDTRIAERLLHTGASIRMTKEVLHGAVKMSCLKIVEITLNETSNLDFNETDYQGRTTLHHALDSELDSPSRAEIVKMLIDRGALVNAKTENNTTALHLAVEGGYAKAVEVLLANGADVHAVGELNKTPLLLAVTGKSTDIFKMLLDSGANVNDRQDDQNTALHIASKNGAIDIIKLLAERGADLDAEGEEGLAPLHLTCDDEVIETLLTLGAYVDAGDPHGITVLHYGLNFEPSLSARGIQIFFDHGANVNHAGIKFESNTPWEEDIHKSEVVIKHIVALMTLDLEVSYVSDKVKETSNYHDVLADCQTNLAIMKTKAIGDTNVTLYDVLTKDINRVMMYCQNESFVEAVQSENLDDFFPTHANMIRQRIRAGLERKKLIIPSINSLNALFGFVLPEICSVEVFNNLSNEDLKNLINADPTDDDSDN